MLLVLLPLLLVGTHRATRILTRDKLPLVHVPREAFVCRWGVFDDAVGPERRLSMNGKPTNVFMSSLAYLWTCDWCMSIWVGAGLTYLTWRFPETMLWVLGALTASTATGLLTKAED